MRTITMSNELGQEWTRAFGLREKCDESFSSIIGSILALNTLADEVPSGYFLARQKINIKKSIPWNSKIMLKGEITKQKDSKRLGYMTCKAQVIMEEDVIIEVDSTLVRTDQPEVAKDLEKSILQQGQEWRRFSVTDINNFAMLSGDPNGLHTGPNPIVQGMLILLALEDKLTSDKEDIMQWNVQYRLPIRADEEISLIGKNAAITGVVGNKLCFILNYGGDQAHEKHIP